MQTLPVTLEIIAYFNCIGVLCFRFMISLLNSHEKSFLIAPFYIAITFSVLPLRFILACKRVCICSSMNVHMCARSCECLCVCAVTRGNLKPCHKAAFAIFLLTHR